MRGLCSDGSVFAGQLYARAYGASAKSVCRGPMSALGLIFRRCAPFGSPRAVLHGRFCRARSALAHIFEDSTLPRPREGRGRERHA